MPYAIGHNMPGYLPESDVFHTRDYDTARQVLVGDLEHYQDALSMMGDEDDYPEETFGEIADAIVSAEMTFDGDEIEVYAGDCVYWIMVIPEEDFAPDDGSDIYAV